MINEMKIYVMNDICKANITLQFLILSFSIWNLEAIQYIFYLNGI